MPTVGGLGPDFALYNQDQHMVQLGRLQSEADFVVVYFFPQAGAPGCAREAIGFRDIVPELAKRRVKVVGITASPASEITAFAKEHNLNFDVLCDSMRRISEEWGALRNDNTARMTFIVNAKGVITHMFPRVDVWKHAAEVLTLFPQSSEAAAAETPASTTAQAPAQVASSNAPAAAQAAAHPPVSAGHSAGPDLVAEAARAVLKLLLMHKQSGGAIPPDVSELLAQLGRNA
ncbi:MAG TPA: redoxin domain-containing protein [Pseudomonadota bacterium]|nr:redoxin domain-containing protein [Pseudomonadota bacterium]